MSEFASTTATSIDRLGLEAKVIEKELDELLSESTLKENASIVRNGMQGSEHDELQEDEDKILQANLDVSQEEMLELRRRNEELSLENEALKRDVFAKQGSGIDSAAALEVESIKRGLYHSSLSILEPEDEFTDYSAWDIVFKMTESDYSFELCMWGSRACSTITSIAVTDDNQERYADFIDAGGCEAIVKALERHGSDEIVALYAASTISNLCQCPTDVAGYLGDCDAIEAILLVIPLHIGDLDVCEFLASALRGLTESNPLNANSRLLQHTSVGQVLEQLLCCGFNFKSEKSSVVATHLLATLSALLRVGTMHAVNWLLFKNPNLLETDDPDSLFDSITVDDKLALYLESRLSLLGSLFGNEASLSRMVSELLRAYLEKDRDVVVCALRALRDLGRASLPADSHHSSLFSRGNSSADVDGETDESAQRTSEAAHADDAVDGELSGNSSSSSSAIKMRASSAGRIALGKEFRKAVANSAASLEFIAQNIVDYQDPSTDGRVKNNYGYGTGWDRSLRPQHPPSVEQMKSFFASLKSTDAANSTRVLTMYVHLETLLEHVERTHN
jgi:hypothetical protein